MEENIRAWVMRVAILVWVTSFIGVNYTNGEQLKFTTVSFNTGDVTKESYSQFIQTVRNELASEYWRYEIPVLREEYTVADPERFLLVKLSNSQSFGGASITLALDVINANVVAYQRQRESYFLSDAPELAYSILFKGTIQKKLSFGGNYTELERVAPGANRNGIYIGIRALKDAITELSKGSLNSDNTLARAFIVTIQMIIEAARFRHIERNIRFAVKTEGYHEAFRPDASVTSLENNWKELSIRIQHSNQGVLSKPVQLQRGNGAGFNLDNVFSGMMQANLALMLFVCRSTSVSSSSLPDHDQRLIRPVVPENNNEDTCIVEEPTTKIVGRESKCVDVFTQNFDDGNEIVLYQCKPNLELNQFWTLKRDGTIRSNGMCLRTHSYGPESHAMIYNCSTAPKSTITWKLDRGSILNSQSSWSLSAASTDDFSPLGIEPTTYAARQGWIPTNNTQPFVAPIVGFNDLCLETNDRIRTVSVSECVPNKAQQQWAIYADGTVRSNSQRKRCLACNSDFPGTYVILMNCDKPYNSGWSEQRWMFKNDGTIMNVNSSLVLDVKESNPSLQKVVISDHTRSSTQKWLLLL